MDNNVFLIVLFASVMHAVWNGMVKNHSDKAIAISGIVCLLYTSPSTRD